MPYFNIVSETTENTVVTEYKPDGNRAESYQSEAELEREFKRNGIPLDEEILKEAAQRARVETIDDLYASIGYGGVSMSKVVQRIKENQLRMQREQNAVLPTGEENIEETNRRARRKGIIIEGVDNCMVKFAQCCNPLPGDPIIGFVTRGFGVSIHKMDCINVINNMDSEENKDRWIKASWAGADDTTYRATIDIIAEQKSSVIADITAAIAANHIPMHEMNMHRLKNGNTNLLITIEIAGVEQLANVMLRLKKIPGVISADRTGKQ